MEKTLRVEGGEEVPFFPDDTIERVRELIAIHRGVHPDRLFIQVRVIIPAGYYSTPKHWSDLFLRLSRDGQTVREDELRIYLSDVHPGAEFPVRMYTREDWDAVDPTNSSLRHDSGQEWHILGTKAQPVLPRKPKDVELPANMMPILSMQTLFESLHELETDGLRIEEAPAEPSDAVRRVYFPRFDPKRTMNALPEATAKAILKSQELLRDLLKLNGVQEGKPYHHKTAGLTKMKWVISLDATKIVNPRVRFEQMFYGLTLSKETPFVGYYTSGEAKLRSKVYVENPETKVPSVNMALVKSWYAASMPNRRRPTLLLYRGSSASVFQRIAITSMDITIDIRKGKGSTHTEDAMKKEANEWLQSLDAVMPFLDERDLALDRWKRLDMSLTATYGKEETTFNMLRFDCLRSIFVEENGTFRLLRSDQGKISDRQKEACRVLTQDDVSPTAESLANALGTSIAEAKTLLDPILSGQVDCERALQDYPEIRFERKEAEINFVTNPDRVLKYVDILRYVLTTKEDGEVTKICPARGEAVPALSIVPQNAAVEDEEDDDEGFDISELTVSGANAAAAPPPPPPVLATGARTVQVAEEKKNTQNYFNARLQDFNKELFGPPYSKECEKNNQVVVLTPEDRQRIEQDTRIPEGEKGHYVYDDAPADQKLTIPGGLAICPAYWCMTDLIPLREEDLKTDAEGVKHCPICKGKVRPNDKVSPREYPVIKRQASKGRENRYPRMMGKDKKDDKEEVPSRNRKEIPCCYPSPPKDAVDETHRADVNYILGDTSNALEPSKKKEPSTEYSFRAGRLSAELAERMGLTTSYDKTIVNKRLDYDAEDIFRIGLGSRPRDTLPQILEDKTPIPDPNDRKDVVRQCSFYATAGKDPYEEIQRKWTDGSMDALDQIEYMSFFLGISVILIDALNNKVDCGFQADRSKENAKTIAIFVYGTKAPPELLGLIRRKKKSVRTAEVTYETDLTDPRGGKLAGMSAHLQALRRKACQGGLPTVENAREALKLLGYDLDPNSEKASGVIGIQDETGQLSFFLVRNAVLLPFVPVSVRLTEYVPNLLFRIHQIPTKDLPDYTTQTNAMKRLSPVFHHAPAKDHANANGDVVEVETVSGMRIPINPEPVQDLNDPTPRTKKIPGGPSTEIYETLRTAKGVTPKGTELKGVRALLMSKSSIDAELDGRALKDKIDYQSELYEFILFSLANDIATDRSGDATKDFGKLRDAIERRDAKALNEELDAWYKDRVDETIETKAYEFLSKVRTPCGQLSPKACENSLLCGWVKTKDEDGMCKIQVRTTQVDRNMLLMRVRQTLLENDKQRALVLDNRMSRFFSTMLFQELPHELFTTV